MHGLSLYEIAQQQALNYPDTTALVYERHRYTFAEVADRSRRLSALLHSKGVSEGDRILWLGQNSGHVLEILLACSRLGAALCIANWRQSFDEVRFAVADIFPKVVFWQADGVDLDIEGLQALSNEGVSWIPYDANSGDGYITLVDNQPDLVEAPLVADSSVRPLMLLYTAAFDGIPHAAQISETGLLYQAMVHIPALDIRLASSALISTPMFHIVAWLYLLPTFLMGGKSVVARLASAEDLCRLIHDERPVNGRIHAVTAKEMVKLNADRRYDLSCFRSDLSIDGWREMTCTGPQLSGYGQTETIGPVIIGSLAGGEAGGVTGRPSPLVQARIVDPAGNDVPQSESGELLIKGPTSGLGYWNRPEVNAERLKPGGWWATGDLARRNPDGTISFLSPKKHMIKSGAENIYPAEVESVMCKHPAVKNAAIIGVPDPVWHQRVTAIIELKPGDHVSDTEIMDFVKQQIARYKAPKAVHFLDKLPLLANGQPDYSRLDADFGGGNYPGLG